jgi:hypothetical protein
MIIIKSYLDKMRGFIYRIDVDDKHYIGSSTLLIPELRLYNHIQDYNRIDRKKCKLYLYIEKNKEGKWDDVKISIIEENDYESKKELRNKEYEYINNDIDKENSLNTLKSYKQEIWMIMKRIKNNS